VLPLVRVTPATGIGGLPQDIASFAKEYTTPGASFYGNARNYAQGILGSQGFNSSLGGVGDQTDKFGMYQALVPLLYGGANPMIQQSVADQLEEYLRTVANGRRAEPRPECGHFEVHSE
jgi:hypothetical protein